MLIEPCVFGGLVHFLFFYVSSAWALLFLTAKFAESVSSRVGFIAPMLLAIANSNEADLLYVWHQATPEAKFIILCLSIFSIIAWSVMIAKAVQMRRVKRLNQ